MIQKAKKTREKYGWNVTWSVSDTDAIDVPDELVGTVFVTFVDFAACGTRDNAVLEAALVYIHPIIKRLGVDASCVEVSSVRALYSRGET